MGSKLSPNMSLMIWFFMRSSSKGQNKLSCEVYRKAQLAKAKGSQEGDE